MTTTCSGADAIRFRPDSMDEAVFREQGRRDGYKLLPINDGDVVLDIGGHVGFFALYALAQGASEVWSIEPDKANYEQGVKHTVGQPVRWTNQAVAAQDGFAPFYRHTGRDLSGHSLVAYKGRVATTVRTVALNRVISWMEFDVVKVDIEGGEYGLDLSVLPASCRSLAVELHLNRKAWRQAAAPALVQGIEGDGWTAIRDPDIGADQRFWNTVGVWTR